MAGQPRHEDERPDGHHRQYRRRDHRRRARVLAGGALGIVAVGSVGAWIISIIGAVVLLAILKALNIYK